MKVSIFDIASLVSGKITGDGNVKIYNAAKIEEAQKGDLTFLYSPPYEKYFSATKASVILVKNGFEKSRSDIIYIEVEAPERAFTTVLMKYFSPTFSLDGIAASASIHKSAIIGNGTAIGENVVISPNCKIGNNVRIFHNTVILDNVEIGDNTLIFQNVSIRENCKIGKRIIIHANSVVGSDGFGYIKNEGRYVKVPQIGNVVIEDDVEIGSNVSIDRAALGSTLIKRGVKIDNLVQVAHNVEIGEDTAISGQSGISGSTRIGKNCIFGGQVGLADHLEISDNVLLAAQSGVPKSILKPGIYFGSPAKERKTAFMLEAHLRNLGEYVERIKTLEKELIKLKDELARYKS